MSKIRNHAVTLALMLSIGWVPPAFPEDETLTGDRGSDMVVDLIVTRPIGLAATVVGSAVFVIALPFTLPSGSVGESACALIERPAAYTFMRPLGDLNECKGGGCKPCGAPAKPR